MSDIETVQLIDPGAATSTSRPRDARGHYIGSAAKSAPRKTAKRPHRRATRPRSAPAAAAPPDAPPIGTAPAYPAPPPDKDVQDQVHGVAMAVILAVTAFMAVEVQPTRYEVEAILLPAERIFYRRVNMPGINNPDVADVLAIVVGVLSYGSRIAPALVSAAARPAGGRNHQQPAATPASPAPAPPGDTANGLGHSYLAGIYGPVLNHAVKDIA